MTGAVDRIPPAWLVDESAGMATSYSEAIDGIVAEVLEASLPRLKGLAAR
jgi:hypothetical protein